MIPPKHFDIFPPDWGMLRRSRCVQIFLKIQLVLQLAYVEESQSTSGFLENIDGVQTFRLLYPITVLTK